MSVVSFVARGVCRYQCGSASTSCAVVLVQPSLPDWLPMPTVARRSSASPPQHLLVSVAYIDLNPTTTRLLLTHTYTLAHSHSHSRPLAAFARLLLVVAAEGVDGLVDLEDVPLSPVLDVNPAAVNTMSGRDAFGFSSGFTPQIGDGPLSPSLFELDDDGDSHGSGFGGGFHPDHIVVAAATATVDTVVAASRVGVVALGRAGSVNPHAVPQEEVVAQVFSIELTTPTPAVAPELPEFPEVKRRRKQTRVPDARRDAKYHEYRVKNTAKAKDIRDRKREERKAAKARLDNANDRNRRLRAAVQHLESALQQLKSRADGTQ